MINGIADMSRLIVEAINDFWDGITIVDPDKLIIDGDNIL